MPNESRTRQPVAVNLWPASVMIQSDAGIQGRSVQTPTLFQGLSENQWRGILSSAVLRRFKRGEFFFVQGERVRRLILLQSGTVKHNQTSSDGKEVLLRISHSGDVLNVHGAPSSGLHTHSARAMEKGEALIWEYRQIESFCAKCPQLRTNLDRLLVLQLEELEERFREIATETVARRLALLLVRLCDRCGRKSMHGLRVSITREELAQMTGTTVFTISRLLVRWAQRGFLVAQRQAIVVNDTTKLALVKDVETFRGQQLPCRVTSVPWR